MIRFALTSLVVLVAAVSMISTSASTKEAKKDKYHEMGNTRIVYLKTADPKTGYQPYQQYLDTKKLNKK